MNKKKIPYETTSEDYSIKKSSNNANSSKSQVFNINDAGDTDNLNTSNSNISRSSLLTNSIDLNDNDDNDD